MTEVPRISVITPSYNQGQFIRQTIESVLNQDYPDLEYIVIDGGSTDETLDVLGSFDGRLHWVSEADRGQSHAINKGLKRATGEIVSFLNSDDLLEPHALSKVGHFFAARPAASWLTGKCHTIGPEGRDIRRWVTRYKNLWLRFGGYNVLKVLNYVSQPATFWRRRVIETVGYFDERWQYAMDYDYSLRVGRHFKRWFLDDYLACFRIHPASKAGASAAAQFDVDLEIAAHHVASSWMVRLHALHNAIIVAAYRLSMARTNVLAG